MGTFALIANVITILIRKCAGQAHPIQHRGVALKDAL